MNKRISEVLAWTLRQPVKPKPEYLYVISDDGETLKIGVSKNPKKRLTNIRTNSGRPNLKIFKTWEYAGDVRRLERYVFTWLLAYRYAGEWYCLSPEQAVSQIEEAMTAYRRNPMVVYERYGAA